MLKNVERWIKKTGNRALRVLFRDTACTAAKSLSRIQPVHLSNWPKSIKVLANTSLQTSLTYAMEMMIAAALTWYKPSYRHKTASCRCCTKTANKQKEPYKTGWQNFGASNRKNWPNSKKAIQEQENWESYKERTKQRFSMYLYERHAPAEQIHEPETETTNLRKFIQVQFADHECFQALTSVGKPHSNKTYDTDRRLLPVSTICDDSQRPIPAVPHPIIFRL